MRKNNLVSSGFAVLVSLALKRLGSIAVNASSSDGRTGPASSLGGNGGNGRLSHACIACRDSRSETDWAYDSVDVLESYVGAKE